MKENKLLHIYTATSITELMRTAVGGLCAISILTKKSTVAQTKVYAATNNDFAEPAQSPWASSIPLRWLWLLQIKLKIKITALISKKETPVPKKKMMMGLSRILEVNGKNNQAVCIELK